MSTNHYTYPLLPGFGLGVFWPVWLGLTLEEGYDLFYGHWSEKKTPDITIDDAIDHIHKLIAEAKGATQ